MKPKLQHKIYILQMLVNAADTRSTYSLSPANSLASIILRFANTE